MGHIGKNAILVQFHSVSPYISSFLQPVDTPIRNVFFLFSVVSNHGNMSMRKTLMNSKDVLSSGTYAVFGIFARTKKGNRDELSVDELYLFFQRLQ